MLPSLHHASGVDERTRHVGKHEKQGFTSYLGVQAKGVEAEASRLIVWLEVRHAELQGLLDPSDCLWAGQKASGWRREED